MTFCKKLDTCRIIVYSIEPSSDPDGSVSAHVSGVGGGEDEPPDVLPPVPIPDLLIKDFSGRKMAWQIKYQFLGEQGHISTKWPFYLISSVLWMGISRPLFLFFRLFFILQLTDKFLRMLGFEPRISGVGSNQVISSVTFYTRTVSLIVGVLIL